MDTLTPEQQRIIVAGRLTFWDFVAAFLLSFAIVLCFFLGIKLITRCGTEGSEIMNTSTGRTLLVICAIAFAVSLQKPRGVLQGLYAGLGTAFVASSVTIGFCGVDSLQGSILFLAIAPLLSGIVLGWAQHNKVLDY